LTTSPTMDVVATAATGAPSEAREKEATATPTSHFTAGTGSV